MKPESFEKVSRERERDMKAFLAKRGEDRNRWREALCWNDWQGWVLNGFK